MWPGGREEGVTYVPWGERQSPQVPRLRHLAPERQGYGAQWIGP